MTDRMTGSDVWNLISPILAQLVDLTKNTEYIEAYTTVYRALKKLDEEGYWTGYDGQYCFVCGLPWNYYMTMNGDDIGYFDPMPNFCPNCGAKMRSDEE